MAASSTASPLPSTASNRAMAWICGCGGRGPADRRGRGRAAPKGGPDGGGGARFDLRSNRLLGRAYLAQMFRRYGNWGDALAAYNWGPGNLDQWIAAGRPAYRLAFGGARDVSGGSGG